MGLFGGVSLVFVIRTTILFLALRSGGGTQFVRKMFNVKNSKDGTSQFYLDTSPKSHAFSMRYFGAVGDGWTDDTAAFTMAWKAACKVESSVLLAPEGYIFMINPATFNGPCKPGLTFQVDGVLMPPDGPYFWPKSISMTLWLVFIKLDRMTLTGNGIIERNGEKWWELPCKPHRGPNGTTLPGPCESPALFMFFMSSNLHVELTKSVGTYDTNIANGDDCISIGRGCSDVDIKNITCMDSHGISIGSLGMQNTHACVSNITVRNVSMKDSDNGVRIKTWQGGSGSVSGVTFQDIEMDNVRNCIIVDQYYCLAGMPEQGGTYDVITKPVHFACSDTVPCMNITISEVNLLPSEGKTEIDPFCWNVYGKLETETEPRIRCLREGEPDSISERFRGVC
ncbi:hypothetical protein MKX01_029162 [Papaver californicum]|nr:hypothetical protein MKX01_029162 [Papaver californicum]